MRAALLAAALLLLLPPAVAQDDEPQVTDPEGDASWYGPGSLDDDVREHCWVGGAAASRACSQVNPDVGRHGRTPAPATLDIVHARFEDDGRDLHVELALASLSADFSGMPLDVDQSLEYGVCWAVADAPCRDGAQVDVYLIEGRVALDSWYFRSDEHCGRVGSCALNVPFEIVPGTPGFLRWRIPRSAMPDDTVVLAEPAAFSEHNVWGPGDPSFNYKLSRAEAEAAGGASLDFDSAVDDTAVGRDFPLRPRIDPFDPAVASVPWWDDETGDALDDRLDLEVLGTGFGETNDTLTVSTQVARVDDVPADHRWFFALIPTTGAGVVAGFDAAGGVRTEYAGRCDDACEPHPNVPLSKPAQIEVVAGEPGWINVTFHRSDLGNPAQGDMLAQMYTGLLRHEAQSDWQAREGLRVGKFDQPLGDWVWDAPPWWFQLGPVPNQDAGSLGVYLEDPLGDVSSGLDTVAASSDLDTFDITSLRVYALSSDEMRLELGVRDLSSVAVPPGYDAVFYSVALQMGEGAFVAGYYDDGTQKSFFCAPDTALLSEPRTDPQQVIWQPIRGIISLARDRTEQAGGASTPGSIIFVAPYFCFNTVGGDDLHAEALAGGSFLLRGVQGTSRAVIPMDDVRSEGAVVVEGTAVAPPLPAWYSQPFGVENFWDITGIVFAVLVAVVGLLAVARKRSALKRYLAEIDGVLAEHAADAPKREAALHALRDRLKRDLLRNRIADGHFVIVEGRLERHLAGARVETLAQTFDDLPHALLGLLKDLLKDGRMAEEDFAVFDAQLSKTRLTAEAKDDVRRRARAWVADDAALPPP